MTLHITLRKVRNLALNHNSCLLSSNGTNLDLHCGIEPFYTVVSSESHLNQSWSFPIQTCEVLLQFGVNKRFFKTSIKWADIFWNKHFSTQDALFP